MPLIVEYLWSNISETSCEGRKRLPRSFEVFGTVTLLYLAMSWLVMKVLGFISSLYFNYPVK